MPKNNVFHRWNGSNEFTPNEFRVFLMEDVIFKDWRPTTITLHHTYLPEQKDWRGMKSLDALARYYRSVKKWSRGPHFFVSESHWYVLCPPTMSSVHAVSFNATGWSVEAIHNGDTSPFGPKLSKTLYSGMASLFERAQLDPKKHLTFHRDDPKTLKTCPGLKISKAEVMGGILSAMHREEPIERHYEDGVDTPLYIDGVRLKFNAERIDGHTFAPVRALAGALGATIHYTPKPKSIVVIKDNYRVDITDEVDIQHGVGWSAVRPLTEALGYLCVWNRNGVYIERKRGVA